MLDDHSSKPESSKDFDALEIASQVAGKPQSGRQANPKLPSIYDDDGDTRSYLAALKRRTAAVTDEKSGSPSPGNEQGGC